LARGQREKIYLKKRTPYKNLWSKYGEFNLLFFKIFFSSKNPSTLHTDKGYRISVKTIYKIYEVYGISFCLRFKKKAYVPNQNVRMGALNCFERS
jgi:hypothetical protein